MEVHYELVPLGFGGEDLTSYLDFVRTKEEKPKAYKESLQAKYDQSLANRLQVLGSRPPSSRGAAGRVDRRIASTWKR